MERESQPIRIGLDMDGVVIDHTELRLAMGKQFGFDLTPEQTVSDIISKLVPDNIWKEMQNGMYYNADIALQATPMAGLEEGMRALLDAGFPTFLISRRRDTALAKRLLEKYALWPSIFNESNTFFVNEIDEKNERAQALELTHYIDDQERVLSALLHVPNKLLFDQYDNRHNSPYERIVGWENIVRYFLPEK